MELDGEAKKLFSKKTFSRNKFLNKTQEKNVIKGSGISLLRRNSLIHFSPFKKIRRSSSFIDLSIITKKLSDCDKKGLKIKNENINSFSLLTNKNFYKNSPQYKSNKILLKNKLLNTSEEKDNHFDNKKESNENEVTPFLFQLNENYYNIKNKGQFLLEHRKTVEDICL